MQSETTTRSIRELLELRENNMLTINPEYQRGAVWTSVQQKKLIDSIFRGYPLPIIYVHHRQKAVAGLKRDDLEIIDGQQRLNAMALFKAGGITLFDPIGDDKVARFPNFVKNQPCPWARLSFDSLAPELQEQFLNTQISVATVLTENDDEARDLFIRLQAGLPLNSQEKRDAWPGGFTHFVLKLGGKTNNISYPGHDFFKELVYKTSTDRGQVRQLCAQVSMLFFEKATSDNWMDIGNTAIDDYYYKNLSFDVNSDLAQSFKNVMNKLYSIFGNRGLKKLKGHEVIHVTLLAADLLQNYAPSWEGKILNAFETFRANCAKAKNDREGAYWNEYVQWTMTNSDTKSSLQKRHLFFTREIYKIIKPQLLDKVRIFGEVERQLIYYSEGRKCAVCDAEVSWVDLEIHHIHEHYRGGQTTLKNGVPVHKKCHPKGRSAEKFAEELAKKKNKRVHSL